MSRRTVDFAFAGGGLALAVLLFVLGFVLADQASFARSYVKDQLGQQKITFTTSEKLTAADTEWKPGSICLVENAGKLMETGAQAECYANHFIAHHVETSATAAGYPGETYATLGAIQSGLRAEVAAARTANDTTAVAAAQTQLDAVTSLRASAQTGETLRGLLLTSYGFSIFGEKAALAGTVCFAIAGLLALLAVLGFIHALRTPREERIGAPEDPSRKRGETSSAAVGPIGPAGVARCPRSTAADRLARIRRGNFYGTHVRDLPGQGRTVPRPI